METANEAMNQRMGRIEGTLVELAKAIKENQQNDSVIAACVDIAKGKDVQLQSTSQTGKLSLVFTASSPP
jgi:hypothetical protein